MAAGRNPIAARRQAAIEASEAKTFGEVAAMLLDDLTPQWKNEKHRAQWKTTLETDAAALHRISVAHVTTEDVLDVLKPIWAKKPETASRLRGRIERVLDAAKAKGLRTEENPARWKGHLVLLLPKRQRLTRGHHAAMPFDDVHALIAALRPGQGIGARALEFTILTAARTGETIGAVAEEFDLDAGVWAIPADRMKAGREHRVPLPPRALDIIRELWPERGKGYIFRSLARNKPISNMTMAKTLRDLGHNDITVHGFRSSFRDWAGEQTNFPREVIEAALAHLVGDDTEQAYRRGDALAKRGKLMDAWARL